MNRTDFSVHPSEIDLAEVAEDAVRRYEQQAEVFGVTLARLGRRPVAGGRRRGPRAPGRLEPRRERAPPHAARRRGARRSPRPACSASRTPVPGLEDEDSARAFERFYLHERYGRERPVGTGLGLAIVKELTEAMGGTVEVASEPGTLTAFTIRLTIPRGSPRRLRSLRA